MLLHRMIRQNINECKIATNVQDLSSKVANERHYQQKASSDRRWVRNSNQSLFLEGKVFSNAALNTGFRQAMNSFKVPEWHSTGRDDL